MSDSVRVLLINDDEPLSKYLREKLIINGGYFVDIESGVEAAMEAFRKNDFDIVLVKFGMLDLDGPSIVKNIKQIDQDSIIIALIDELNPDLLKVIMKLNIYDYLIKPINMEKLFFLIKKGAELHSLISANRRISQSFKEQNNSLQKQNTLLAKRIEESTKNLTKLYEDLRSTYMRTIKVLAHAIDARDHYTHSHSENVAKYATLIAKEMHLTPDQIEVLREACELHDLGKIGVEDSILMKPSALTPEEWMNIKRHPDIGAQILEPLTFLDSVIDLVRQHHEHFDGTGYPQGLKGEGILLGARIIHIADAYEAMVSARSYRKVPLSKDAAIEEIKKYSGTQFDPKVVSAFLKVVDQFHEHV